MILFVTPMDDGKRWTILCYGYFCKEKVTRENKCENESTHIAWNSSTKFLRGKRIRSYMCRAKRRVLGRTFAAFELAAH